jgi:hypothetical protein
LKDKDYIHELFSEKLSQLESPVRPDLWNGIQAQLGASAAASSVVAKGISTAAKWWIGVAATAVTATGIYVAISSEKNNSKEVISQKSIEKKDISKNNTISTPPTVSSESTNSEKSSLLTSESTIKNQSTNHLFLSNDTDNASTPYIVKQRVENSVSQIANTGSLDGNSATDNQPIIERYTKLVPSIEDVVQNTVNPKPVVGIFKELPNVITPNGDYINDYFQLEMENITDFVITILNDKNQVVFKSSDQDFKWDGSDLPDGKGYFYMITCVDTNGNKINKLSPLEIKRTN